MRSNGTSNSSATICANAVSTPVPRSTLPLKTVTVPSVAIASHESSDVGSASIPGPTVVCPKTGETEGKRLKLTINAPVPLRNCLRDSSMVFMFVLPGLTTDDRRPPEGRGQRSEIRPSTTDRGPPTTARDRGQRSEVSGQQFKIRQSTTTADDRLSQTSLNKSLLALHLLLTPSSLLRSICH